MAVHLVGSWQADHVLLDDNAKREEDRKELLPGAQAQAQAQDRILFSFLSFFFFIPGRIRSLER